MSDIQAELDAMKRRAEAAERELVRRRMKPEDACTTLDDWRMRAYDLEARWSDSSHHCAVIQTERDEAQRKLAEARELLRPFAALLQDHNDKGLNDRPIFAINGATITLGDLRRVAAALGDAQ